MAANYDLIALLEQFWTCKRRNGYVRILMKGTVTIARIAEINSLPTSRYDRIIKLESTDINGKEIKDSVFKLSDLLSVEQSVILNVIGKN